MGKCEHAIGIPGRTAKTGSGHDAEYEIGVMRSRDGKSFRLAYDSYGAGRRLEEKAGRDLQKLRQEYAVAVATKKAKKLKQKGFTLKRENMPNGKVRLLLRKR